MEWIDAGVVYHKNGATGLLRYAAVLASGADAHLTSTNILVSDLADGENTVGDSSGGSDINVMESLGKFISEKSFDGVTLRDSSVAQLTTAFRILAFISENSVCNQLFINCDIFSYVSEVTSAVPMWILRSNSSNGLDHRM